MYRFFSYITCILAFFSPPVPLIDNATICSAPGDALIEQTAHVVLEVRNIYKKAEQLLTFNLN